MPLAAMASAFVSSAAAGTLTAGAAGVGGTAAAGAGLSTLSEISMGASLLQGVGDIITGSGASQADKVNAEIARNNQIVAEQNATATAREGEINAARSEQKTKAAEGGMLAQAGASGVDVNSQSTQQTLQSEQEVGQLNAINIRSQAARQAYGYQTQGQQYGIEAQQAASSAKYAPIEAGIKAGTSLLSGAANPYNAYIASKGFA